MLINKTTGKIIPAVYLKNKEIPRSFFLKSVYSQCALDRFTHDFLKIEVRNN
jgi:hypothetical protein